MKKALLILVVMVVTVCSFVSAMAKGDRLEQIKEKGYIEFCTEPYWAPNEFIDPNKTGDEQYVGSDIELAKLIADTIGVELKLKDSPLIIGNSVETVACFLSSNPASAIRISG